MNAKIERITVNYLHVIREPYLPYLGVQNVFQAANITVDYSMTTVSESLSLVRAKCFPSKTSYAFLADLIHWLLS